MKNKDFQYFKVKLSEVYLQNHKRHSRKGYVGTVVSECYRHDELHWNVIWPGARHGTNYPASAFDPLYMLLRGEGIEEGDDCVCNFNDCGLKFWFTHDQILKVKIVQKLTTTPNKLFFEGIENYDGFYANSFTRVRVFGNSNS